MGSFLDQNSVFVLDLECLTSLFCTVLTYSDDQQLKRHQLEREEGGNGGDQQQGQEQREERKKEQEHERKQLQPHSNNSKTTQTSFSNGAGRWANMEAVLFATLISLKKKEEEREKKEREEEQEREKEGQEKEGGEGGELEEQEFGQDQEEEEEEEERKQEQQRNQQQQTLQHLHFLKTLLQQFNIAYFPPSPTHPFFLSLAFPRLNNEENSDNLVIIPSLFSSSPPSLTILQKWFYKPLSRPSSLLHEVYARIYIFPFAEVFEYLNILNFD